MKKDQIIVPVTETKMVEVQMSHARKAQIEAMEKVPREEWVRKWWEDFVPNEHRAHYIGGKGRPDLMECHGKAVSFHNREGDELRALIYRPENSEGKKLPVYFHIHGGGFVMGCPEMNDHELTRYSQESGICCIGLEYRLPPDDPFPASMNDCYDGIKYFVDHADEFCIDTEHMGVGGESAGGILAFDMVLLSIRKKEFAFNVALMIYGGVGSDIYTYDLAPEELLPDLTWLMLTRGCYVEDPELLKDPLNTPFMIDDEELAQFPATVIMTAENDYAIRNAEGMGFRMAMLGVPVTMRRFMGQPHGFALKCDRYWKDEVGEEGIKYLCDGMMMYL